ncbi:MAG: TlpA family protein disulfide reductase [Flammeovirgaceae bacterium]|nr:TlpA family protein disulfide reductase [Flammeovirgaceae bacterium]
MKRIFVVLLILITVGVQAQKPETIKLKQLQQWMGEKTDRIKVLNFWATWCAPCIKEMPYFEKLNQENKEVDVMLVSMDLELDPNPEKVYRFVDRKKLTSKVVLLDEKNPNSWIDKIEEQWQGSLPATIIINPKTGQRKFVGKELHEGDLEKLIAEIQ